MVDSRRYSPASSETLTTHEVPQHGGSGPLPERNDKRRGLEDLAGLDRTREYEEQADNPLPDAQPNSTLRTTATQNASGTDVERQVPESSKENAYIVHFDGPDDPDDPRNMTKGRKWSIVLIIAFCSLCV